MKIRATLLVAMIFLFGCENSKPKIPLSSTIKIEATDTKEMIIEKAAHVVPTANQHAGLRNEFIAFIHIGPNTFTRMEWGNGKESPDVFALKELDTDQWCRAIKAAGMKMVVITVKHHDGFALWQTRYTKHGVMSTSFRDGKGDILKDLSESCAKYGLKLGVYLSPADLYQIENSEGLYGNLSQYTKRTIPREVPGRPFANKTTFEFEVDDYNEYFLNQLFELLTEYGPVHEVWFDGAHPKRKGGQKYNYAAWQALIDSLAPEALVFGRKDIRWCGNESGGTRDTEWNVIPYATNPLEMGAFADLTDTILADREKLYEAKYLHYQQAETNTSIREGWFYRDENLQKVRSVDDVFDIYERSVGGNSTYLLNLAPNREGTISERDVAVLEEVGKRIEQTYGVDLLKGAQGERAVLDGDDKTYYEVKKGEIIISMPEPITLNRLVLQEAIATHSERVERHAIDAMVDGQWQEIARATNIGYKRIARFADITTDKIRVRILESRQVPAISNITAHYYESRPPRLVFDRDADGMVVIKPFVQEFGWKPHGEDVTENLHSGLKIYYTTDGSEPDETSAQYSAPIRVDNVVLKAVAINNGMMGATQSEQLGLAKKAWTLVGLSSEAANHGAANAFDSNSKTFWMSNSGARSYIAIDLGAKHELAGFAYTPQSEGSKGMMTKGELKISDDGKSWSLVEPFSFGNLINDPTKRYHYFKDAVSSRYVKIEITQTAEDVDAVSIAEIDLF